MRQTHREAGIALKINAIGKTRAERNVDEVHELESVIEHRTAIMWLRGRLLAPVKERKSHIRIIDG